MSFSLKTSAKEHNFSHTREEFWYYQFKIPKFHRFYLSKSSQETYSKHLAQKSDFYRSLIPQHYYKYNFLST